MVCAFHRRVSLSCSEKRRCNLQSPNGVCLRGGGGLQGVSQHVWEQQVYSPCVDPENRDAQGVFTLERNNYTCECVRNKQPTLSLCISSPGCETTCWWFLPVVTVFIPLAGLAADQPSHGVRAPAPPGMCFPLRASAACSDLDSGGSQFSSMWVLLLTSHRRCSIGNTFSEELLHNTI